MKVTDIKIRKTFTEGNIKAVVSVTGRLYRYP